MEELKKTVTPFEFYTRLHLSELTGLRAATLKQLLNLLREVPGSCIYHHTHRFLQQHQYLSPEPPNDFAHWVTEVLGEHELGERLASIDTVQFSTIRALREKIIATIEEYLKENPGIETKSVRWEEEFHFIKSISFVLQTDYIAYNLKDFVEALDKISINSIYFHIFEARLRLEKGANDFSNWIDAGLGEKRLAQEIARLDPYSYTMEDLRKVIIKMAKKRISA